MDQFKNWWQSTTEREQILAICSALFLVFAALYWAVWQPLVTELEDSQKQLNRAEQTLNWVEDKATLLVQSGVTGNKNSSKKANLGQIVNRTAKQQGIKFSRVVNRKGQIEVWINDVEFNRFISWLTLLSNKHSVSAVNADISKLDKEGFIKINRLLLGY